MSVVDQYTTINHDKEAMITELRAQLAKQLAKEIEHVPDEYLITSLLLAEQSVEDCTVVRRQVVDQVKRVAYVVTSGFSQERLTKHLQTYLPADLMPDYYVPVSVIPLTPKGFVDVDRLAQIAVLDDDLVDRWKSALEAQPGVTAAVVIQPQTLQSPVVHLSDLLPTWTSVPSQQGASLTETETSKDHTELLTATPSNRMALSYGGDLPIVPEFPQTLPEVLVQAAKTALGDRITYLNLDGTVHYQSYQGLLEDAERVLAGLRQQGLKPQDKVIFQLELSQDILAAFWACILGGFIPVIMGPAPSYRESNSVVDKLCNVWQLIDQPLILTAKDLQSAVSGLSQWLPAESLKVCAIEALREQSPDKNYHPCQPDDLAFFNLTSGSTGMPKCIGLTHRNLISRAQGTNILCNHSEQDVILNWLPFDHIGSISDWHVRCVLLGCHLVYTSKEYILGHPLNWMDLLDKYRVTHSWAPNFAYALVNDNLKQKAEHHWDLSCVRSLLTAGEAVSSNAVEEFIHNLAPYGFPKTAVRPAFGMAEMGSGITYFQPTPERPTLRHVVDKASLTGYVPIRRVEPDHPNCSIFTDLGPVIPGVSMRIVDTQGNVLPEDTVGALQVRGAAVSPGYYKNPEVNKEVFLLDGWFNTGDLGFISNGHLVLSGRAKETIIINGANYYNHEIEAVVEAVEGIEVSFTAACAVRDKQAATEKLAIFFNTPYTQDEQLAALFKKIRQAIVAKAALNPDYLIPLPQSEIPKTAIGKIQRSQLAERFERGEFNGILKKGDLLLRNTNTLPDWFFKKVWQPKQLTWTTVSQSVGAILVFLDRAGVGEQLLSVLNQAGIPSVGVLPGPAFSHSASGRYTVNPTELEDYTKLWAAIAATGATVEKVVHLWTLEPPAQGMTVTSSNWEASLEQGVHSLVSFVQAAANRPEPTPLQLLVASCHSQGIHSNEPIIGTYGMLPALMKAASQELSWLTCCHLDLPSGAPTEQADLLNQELQAIATLDEEVAYRAGERLVPRFARVDWSAAPTQPLPFQPEGLYVITGGLGGIGFEIAQYLLKSFNAKLILLGRTALPERSQWADILKQSSPLAERLKRYQALELLSPNIHYATVDIGDAAALSTLVQDISDRWQTSLVGILHLAGVATDQSILDESRASLVATLYPKVAGALSLQQVALQHPGCLFINFSSVNGFFGGSRAGAYAAANRFLDGLSHTLKQQGIQCYNFAWSMWDEVGMSQGFLMKQFTQLQGYYSIPSHQGLQAFLGCLHHQQHDLWIGLDSSKYNVRRYLNASAVSLQGLKGYFATTNASASQALATLSLADPFGVPSQCLLKQVEQIPMTETGAIDREKLATLENGGTGDRIQPSTETEKALAALWQEVLGVSKVGVQDSFFELGGTSLQAAKLFTRIAEEFGQNLPLSTLFEAQTVEAISRLLTSDEGLKVWSSLVKIQGQGSRPPLFCVHGAGGNILMYQELVPYLEPDQPLYGLQAVGLDGSDPIHHLQEMASVYVDEILQVQPEGPYYLLGLSIGGMVAMEMGRFLRAKGHEVAFLGMIDALGPNYPKLLPLLPRLLSLAPYVITQSTRRIPKFLQKKLLLRRSPTSTREQASSGSPQIEKTATPAKSASRSQRSLQNSLEELSLTVFKYSPWAFVVPRFYLESAENLPTTFQRVQEAAVRAYMDYKPDSYDGDAILFRARQQPPGCYHDPTSGWGTVIKGQLTIYEVPGHHGESLLYKKKSLVAIGSRLNQLLIATQKQSEQ